MNRTDLVVTRRAVEIDRLLVAGYTAHAAGTVDDWGSFGEADDTFLRLAGHRLDNEDGGW